MSVMLFRNSLVLTGWVSLLASGVVAESVQEATIFSEEYGMPLLEFAELAKPLIKEYGTNAFNAMDELATPEDQEVVMPNVDTLYGQVVYDLAEDDVEITVPKISGDRYWSVSAFDPFGSNYGVFGSTDDATAGTYKLRRAADAKVSWGYAPASYGDQDYTGYLNSPSTQGVVLVRILVKNNGTDLDQVQDMLSEFAVTPIPRSSSPGGEVPPLTSSDFDNLGASDGVAVLRLTARLNAANPPFPDDDAASIQATFRRAGIRNGTYQAPAGADPDAAYDAALGAVLAFGQTDGAHALNHRWTRMQPQGLYDGNWRARAAVAQGGYLALVASQSIYPSWAGGALSLRPGDAYEYRFSARPPLAATGFWSLTLYGADQYLVANPLDRYAVGDRSGLTYPDGTPVYGSASAQQQRDGPFTVLVQRADEPPPADWTANWLPAPASDQNVTVLLRVYDALAPLKNGEYEYPVVAKVAAKTGSE